MSYGKSQSHKWVGGPQPSYTFDANNHISGSGISYDPAGNVMNDGFHSHTYDAENRLTQAGWPIRRDFRRMGIHVADSDLWKESESCLR